MTLSRSLIWTLALSTLFLALLLTAWRGEQITVLVGLALFISAFATVALTIDTLRRRRGA